ncbi:ABC transporter permease [Christensenellaceae bacterium OttesenSCG-928-K19]|nr:ABC transporter permease [Christensenellaceae bacterium OttesenSCG-928-K19]
MNLIETLRVIWINLMQNKFKVMLTSLGIIVGAVTIVMVIAIGKGGEDEIAGQFGDLSAATVYVNPDYSKAFLGNTDITQFPKLTEEIEGQIREENPFLKSIMRVMYTGDEVTMNGESNFVNITGVFPEYEEISNLPLALGDNITQDDIDNKSRVAVIGDKLATQYFGTAENAIGKAVKIRNQTYTIVGVLERKGDAIQGMSADDTVFLPYSTVEERLMSDFDLPQMVGLAKDIAYVDKAVERIQSTLNYVLDDGSTYTVEDAGSRIEAATESAHTMNMLLVSVAVIVFIVGGIGIMNVLFVSVKERTKEIGILKALGSSKRDIMAQFLLESIMISLFGGGVGVLLSILLMPLMQYTDIPVSPTMGGKLLALFFSVFTGTLFGFYPAYKASRLKPIDALSYE